MPHDITCIKEPEDQRTPPEPWECPPEFPPYEQTCPFWLENIDAEWIALSDRTGWTPQLIRAVAEESCPYCHHGWVMRGYAYCQCHVCGGTGKRANDG